MKPTIRLHELPNLWPRLNENGINLHTPDDGVVYKYVSFETALKILNSSQILYSSPISFNDPFDLTTDILDLTFSEIEISEMINEFIINEQMKKKVLTYNLENLNLFSDAFINTFEDVKMKIGITCFSKSYMNTLMWSHYANKHNGLCLGFCFKKCGGNGFIQAVVKYATEIKSVKYYRDSVYGIYNWLFTKSHIWNYEQEVRRVNTRKNGLLSFEKSELSEIYFGLKISAEQINQIKKILIEKKYEVKKISSVKMNKHTFDLLEDNNSI